MHCSAEPITGAAAEGRGSSRAGQPLPFIAAHTVREDCRRLSIASFRQMLFAASEAKRLLQLLQAVARFGLAGIFTRHVYFV